MNVKRLLFVAAAAAAMLAWQTVPAQERTLRIATLQGAAQPSYQGLVRMSELVAQRSNGVLKVQVFGDGQLGTEQESIEGVQLGTIDMFHGQHRVGLSAASCRGSRRSRTRSFGATKCTC